MYGYDLKLLIPAATNSTYLNAGTLGPTPSTALAAAAASELEWVEAGAGFHMHYLSAKGSVRRFAERVERAMPGGVVSIVENNSESLLRILWGTRFAPQDEIITTSHEHGAVVLLLSSIMRRFDVKVRVLDVDSTRGLLTQLQEAINERTRMVVMSHVSYLTGWELPVAACAEVVHKWPDCRLVVDGAQALGNVIVQPEALGADYYVFCGHKWMMAPAGWAGLWVSHKRRDELATRWPLEDYQMDVKQLEKGPFSSYSESGDSLEFGTRSWPRIAAWSITWDYFDEEGFMHHRDYQQSLANEARERLNRVEGLTVQDVPCGEYRSTALMAVTCHPIGSGLFDWLYERNVIAKASSSRHGIRLSFAAFNTAEDIERLVAGVQGL